jgi:uncharacterized glyoxalase superfamily protein PhnB
MRVDDVDAYYAEVQGRRAQFIQGLADKPWGMREFGVKSPDGHRIMIGESISLQDEAKEGDE